jgi:hypothetical protein
MLSILFPNWFSVSVIYLKHAYPERNNNPIARRRTGLACVMEVLNKNG